MIGSAKSQLHDELSLSAVSGASRTRGPSAPREENRGHIWKRQKQMTGQALALPSKAVTLMKGFEP